jgi:hypothetical protein
MDGTKKLQVLGRGCQNPKKLLTSFMDGPNFNPESAQQTVVEKRQTAFKSQRSEIWQ